jgi:archaellum component FlaF (FlaF/FlaG flagellin family)
MKKETMKKSYILFGAFLITVVTVITCGDNSSQSVSPAKTTMTTETIEKAVEEKVEEVKVIVEEKVEEIKEVVKEKTEKVIEEKAEEIIEEIIPVELPKLPKVEELPVEIPEIIPEIAPKDTLEEAVE